jgi:hypothetical protein
MGGDTRINIVVQGRRRRRQVAALGQRGIGAKAGYPSITVPAGYQANNRRPFNIAFLGQAWRANPRSSVTPTTTSRPPSSGSRRH